MDPIAEDMAALQGIGRRFPGTEGERAALHAIRQRVSGAGWLVRVEGFVAHIRLEQVALAHAGLLVVVGLIGLWVPGWCLLLAALLTASLLGEATGTFTLLRRLLLKAPSYNLVARNQQPAPMGSVVITANLDVPRSHRPRRSGPRLGERTFQLLFWSAVSVTVFLFVRALAEPFGALTVQLHLGLVGVLAAATLLRLAARRPDPDGREDGGGPAVLLELMRRLSADPVPGVETWIAFTGCGQADGAGVRHFLDLHRGSLAEPVFVVHLDRPARSPLLAVTAEGPVFAREHRATGPALVERLRWAGVELPEIRLFDATDARAVTVRGYRALALSGGDGDASPEAASKAADLVEVLVRWYAQDVAAVVGRKEKLEALGEALERLRAGTRRRWRRRAEPDKDPEKEAQAGDDPVDASDGDRGLAS